MARPPIMSPATEITEPKKLSPLTDKLSSATTCACTETLPTTVADPVTLTAEPTHAQDPTEAARPKPPVPATDNEPDARRSLPTTATLFTDSESSATTGPEHSVALPTESVDPITTSASRSTSPPTRRLAVMEADSIEAAPVTDTRSISSAFAPTDRVPETTQDPPQLSPDSNAARSPTLNRPLTSAQESVMISP